MIVVFNVILMLYECSTAIMVMPRGEIGGVGGW